MKRLLFLAAFAAPLLLVAPAPAQNFPTPPMGLQPGFGQVPGVVIAGSGYANGNLAVDSSAFPRFPRFFFMPYGPANTFVMPGNLGGLPTGRDPRFRPGFAPGVGMPDAVAPFWAPPVVPPEGNANGVPVGKPRPR